MGGRGSSSGRSSASGAGSASGAPALSKGLIQKANEASSGYDIGNATARSYQNNLDYINGTILSDSEKQEAIARLHELTTAQLKAESSRVDPYATGRGVARFDRQLTGVTADKAINARLEVDNYMKEVRQKEQNAVRKQFQTAMTNAMKSALDSGALEFTINGVTYRRKSKRARTFTAG